MKDKEVVLISWEYNGVKVSLAHNPEFDGDIQRYIDNPLYTVTKVNKDA